MENVLAIYESEHSYKIEDMWEDYQANDLFSEEDALLTKEEFIKNMKILMNFGNGQITYGKMFGKCTGTIWNMKLTKF